MTDKNIIHEIMERIDATLSEDKSKEHWFCYDEEEDELYKSEYTLRDALVEYISTQERILKVARERREKEGKWA